MTERCLSPDYQLRGAEFELWADGSGNPGMYPNWWLVIRPDQAGLPQLPRDTVLTGEEPGFDPPLNEREITQIGEAVLGYYSW